MNLLHIKHFWVYILYIFTNATYSGHGLTAFFLIFIVNLHGFISFKDAKETKFWVLLLVAIYYLQEYSHKEGSRCCRCWPPLEGGWPARNRSTLVKHLASKTCHFKPEEPENTMLRESSTYSSHVLVQHVECICYGLPKRNGWIHRMTCCTVLISTSTNVLPRKPDYNVTALVLHSTLCFYHNNSVLLFCEVLSLWLHYNLVQSKAAAAVESLFLLLHTQAPQRPNLHLINQPLHTLFIPLSKHSVLDRAASSALVFSCKPKVRKSTHKIIWSCRPVLKPQNRRQRSYPAKWKARPALKGQQSRDSIYACALISITITPVSALLYLLSLSFSLSWPHVQLSAELTESLIPHGKRQGGRVEDQKDYK